MGYRSVDEPAGLVHLEPLRTRPERVTALSLARPLMRRWWSRQPAHEAIEHVRPMVRDLGADHPARLVAYGAGAGAALVLLKPWKWLPMLAMAGLLARVIAR